MQLVEQNHIHETDTNIMFKGFNQDILVYTLMCLTK